MESLEQCPINLIVWGQCQGALDHDGDHWRYEPDGSYVWRKHTITDLAPSATAGGLIPPGNESWISPINCMDLSFKANSLTTEVTDSEIITKLNSNEVIETDSVIVSPANVDDLLVETGNTDSDRA